VPVPFAEVTVSRSYEQIVQQIQDGILRGEFGHGQKLPTERELGQAFGVSRATVRDAMRVLGTMGLIEARQGSGIYVRHDPVPVVSRALTLSVTPDEQSVDHLFTFREGLETQAVRLATERHSADQLAAMADEPHPRARGWTRAGHALQKHGYRRGSSLPHVAGSPGRYNFVLLGFCEPERTEKA
jgi:DNA-binding FadR family transcriptional regulator